MSDIPDSDKERRRKASEDFDKSLALFMSDPEEFNRQARERINEVIENARPEIRPQLRGLQFTIDMKLQRHKDPIARFNEMINLFWEGVHKLDNALNGKFPPDVDTGQSATILPFSSKTEK